MARTSCIRVPDAPNGEPSRMYQDLLKRLKDRPLVNLLYSEYVASNAAQVMEAAVDAAGNKLYRKNSQGEFNAGDLLKFLNFADIQKETKDLNLAAQQLGAIDSSGKLIDFTDAKDALNKADNFNDNHKGLVATVFQHGDVFNIYVSERNSRTHMQPTEVKEKLAVWNVERQAFNNIGVDIENLPQELKGLVNPNNTALVSHLINIQNINFQWLMAKDALLLFNMDPNSAQVKQLVQSFGSLEDAAKAVEGVRNGQAYTSHQLRVLMNAVKHCQNFQGLDLKALQNQVTQMSTQVKTSSPETNVATTLHKLKKKYGIEINELNLIGKDIDTLSEAAGEAALQIQRKIRELEKDVANNAEAKRLEGIMNQLLKELECKKYYSGVLNFLKEAQSAQTVVDNLWATANAPQAATELERNYERARALMEIKQIKEQYYPVIDALANDFIKIDEAISQTDIDNMRTTAKDLKEYFDKKDKIINELAEQTMEGLLIELIGDEAPDGQSIANLVKMAQKDVSIMDYLYSVGRSSSPVIGAMGKIIRDAQGERDAAMNDIALRIRRATDKLYKSGVKNTEFMYEDEEHLISNIDWKAYNAALIIQKNALLKQGLKGFDFKMALNQWEENNTEDRVVDTRTGRTERVPNGQYRKAFPQLNRAQLDYYNEMMQLKGEIGTLLPAYAQQQYLAPQLRREALDALGKAKNARDYLKIVKNKWEDFYTVREDDTNYAGRGIIGGEEYNYTYGNFDNTRLRQIPIFYVNKVEQGELLKDFSTGIQHLAGTAINYEAMSNIQQVVEFIGDFAKSMPSRENKNEADIVENQFMSITKELYAHAQNTNTSAIIDGYISQHLYGEKRDPRESKKWAKFMDNIIGYTSFKGLATNLKGAFANYLVGEFQMLIEAGCGEFYGLKDYAWAHTKLFGKAGVAGEIMDLFTNNMNSKATLFREMFDPIQENFKDKSGQRYHNNWFRQLIGHDCAFIGYASGEYLIHYVNMYAILNRTKVKLNGQTISLYDAFELGNKQDGNSELTLKQGVTKLDGSAVDAEFLQNIRNRIKYANQTTHGSMNEEDKGLIHRKMLGRAAMNFRQWAVEHYSRRFRKTHFDASLGENREGYWFTYYNYLFNEDTKDEWKSGIAGKARVIGQTAGEAIALMFPLRRLMRDYMTFALRSQVQWDNLNDMQKYNIKRVHQEMMMYVALCCLSFALGEPEKHKKEFWRRWWIYQTKRMMLETAASMPHPEMPKNILTMLQSPMAGVNTLNGFLYAFTGLYQGDAFDTIKSGDHKGENRYIRNLVKYTMPFFKDWEQLQKMDEDESIFQVFKSTPTNR